MNWSESSGEKKSRHAVVRWRARESKLRLSDRLNTARRWRLEVLLQGRVSLLRRGQIAGLQCLSQFAD